MLKIYADKNGNHWQFEEGTAPEGYAEVKAAEPKPNKTAQPKNKARKAKTK